MPRACELTGIKPLTGHKVSHSNIKTKTRQQPNLQRKKYHIIELSESVTFTLSTRAIRTIDKLGGISRALLTVREDGFSPRARRIKHRLVKTQSTKKKKKSA